MDLREIKLILEDGSSQSNDWYSVADHINKKIESDDSPLIIFFYAFRYMLVNKANEEYYQQFGPLAPIITYGNGVTFPPPLNSIDEKTLANWDGILNISSDALICSRLSDLLWIRRWNEKEAYKYAYLAIDAYLDLTKRKLKDTEIPNAFERALDLAFELRNESKKSEVINRIIHYWKKTKIETNQPPRMSLSLLDLLMSLPKDEIPQITQIFIDDLLELYEGNAHILENLLLHKIKLSPDESKDELVNKIIQLWIDEAEKSKENGFIRHAHLLHALELATSAGNKNLINEIKVMIQEIAPESMELHEISVEVEIPKELIDKFFKPFKNSKSWWEGLTSFAAIMPLNSDKNNSLEEIDKQFDESPLRFLVQNIIYDKNNFPIVKGTTIKENKKIALIRNNTHAISGISSFYPYILKLLKDRHGFPENKKMIEYFTTPIISHDLATEINKAIQYYLREEYKITSLYLVPILENIIREIVKMLGLAIYKEPHGLIPGGVYGLGYLLEQLKGRLDEKWRRYIICVLSEPLGFNLRNNISHGLLINPSLQEATLLIHIACYLRHLEINNS